MKIGKDISPHSPALLDALRREGLDSVEGAFAYADGEDLAKPNLRHRHRRRIWLTGKDGHKHELYLKRYRRERLSERLRRWWTYGVRTSPAGVEFDNIQAVTAAGVPAGQAVICGEQWGWPDAKRSYLIVTAVPGGKLEQIISEFLDRNAEQPDVLREFTLGLAELVCKLHGAGYVHRDLYSAHVFLDESRVPAGLNLIDLARVFAPKRRRMRWRVKDLAQLKYSMPEKRWAAKYWRLFLMEYLATDDEKVLRTWNRRIDRKVAAMRRRQRRKHPPANMESKER